MTHPLTEKLWVTGKKAFLRSGLMILNRPEDIPKANQFMFQTPQLLHHNHILKT